MSQHLKPFNRDQLFLVPPSMLDWLPRGDPAYFIIDLVESLDLSAIYEYYAVAEDKKSKRKRRKAASGQPPFHPKVKANASKHKAMTYTRMLAKEEEYAREIEKMLERAEEAQCRCGLLQRGQRQVLAA